MKRAQRFQLEDQRGTEINFELPEFLKANNTHKWKTMNAGSSDTMNSKDGTEDGHKKGKAPQPAPRLSINRNNSIDNCSFSETTNEQGQQKQRSFSSYSQGTNFDRLANFVQK